MNNERDPDGQFCSECGVDMEVIGPPGPRHRTAYLDKKRCGPRDHKITSLIEMLQREKP